MSDLPPALILFLAAAILPFVQGKMRWAVALGFPILALAQSWAVISTKPTVTMQFMDMTLSPVFVHAYTRVFATIFCVMMFGGCMFALNKMKKIELPAAFVYSGGALGVVFSGDLLSMFVFWEIMTLGSTVVIWSGKQKHSYGAGIRYFGLHAVGGVLLLFGIILHVWGLRVAGIEDALKFGAEHFKEYPLDWTTFGAHNAGLWLILIGMLVNAGAPPFSAWVGDAYPEGSESGTVFLSAFTTKTAVFTLMVCFSGTEILIYIGLYMAIYGIVYAILENDMRRILAYSIINQVGFMIVGIGVGTDMALNGVCAHAFSHIIYKALLLMSAGAVLQQTGKRKCTELGGLHHTMKWTMLFGIVGALAISSFPLTSGYTTKTMIVEGVVRQGNFLADQGIPHMHFIVAWFVLEAASAGVFLHAGIKFPWFVFFNKDRGLRPKEAPKNMLYSMGFFAAICIFLGVYPQPLYEILPHAELATEFGAHVYDFAHLMVMLSLLLFAGLAFFVLLPMLKRTESISLDWDWIYRRWAPRFWREVMLPMLKGLNSAQKAILESLPNFGLKEREKGMTVMIRRHMPGSWAVSVPVFTITLMLLAYLVIYFLIVPS
ncbi:MAG: Na(+)/H(+) antiporter subunit D [Planctomycetota bacterium]